MAHHIYTSEGFVLAARPFGEANSFVHVFTRDLGLVPASARSVRELKSKLRYGLQDFCLSSVSFVRGKNEWKITNALPQKNFQHIFADDEKKFLVCAHAFSLIKKLVAGEEKNEALFDIVRSGFEFLEAHNLSPEELLNAECIMMLRIVHNLGYLTSHDVLKPFTETLEQSTAWNTALLASFAPHRRLAIQEINKAIKESQL